MKRVGGQRRKTRALLSKRARSKGKISLTKQLASYAKGDKVCLVAEPAVQGGMFHPKYYGLIGIVQAKRGSCYEVLIRDKNAEKKLIIHPVHLNAVIDGAKKQK